MSIPKEPRQLMISIMYLVLTALLALNVSAEIFNAFAMVDKGLIKANDALDKANENVPAEIKKSAQKGSQFQTYADRVDKVSAIAKEGSAYITEIKEFLITESGGYEEIQGKQQLKGLRDYDATTRLMVNDGKGDALKTKMLDIKKKFLDLIDEADREEFEKKLPIEIEEDPDYYKKVNKKGWSDFTFGHMPVGAVLPIFSKFTNDIKSSEAAVLNYLASKVGLTEEVVLDQFRVVSSPKKSYVINGETFETEVFLSASAGKSSNTGIKLSVNGANLQVNEDGSAKWITKANGIGIKKYTVVAELYNPITKETKPFRSEYEYEVGERSVTISAEKMNVFYIGVDNPVAVSAAGVPSSQVKVSMTNGNISRNSDGTFTVNVSAQGEATVNVSAPGVTASKKFKVKRIPDPVVKLGGRDMGGAIGNGTFKAHGILSPMLEGFDFDARCDILGFKVTRLGRRQDPETVVNVGGAIKGQARDLINKAVPGDRYIFNDIKCKCPGDAAGRPLGSLAFEIQ